MLRVLKWIVTNSLFGWCLWVGLHGGVAGAANLAALYAWFGFVISLFCLSDKVLAGAAARLATHPVPVWLDVIVDLFAVAVFVWHGWWWTGIAYLLHCLFMAPARERAKAMVANGGSAAAGA